MKMLVFSSANRFQSTNLTLERQTVDLLAHNKSKNFNLDKNSLYPASLAKSLYNFKWVSVVSIHGLPISSFCLPDNFNNF